MRHITQCDRRKSCAGRRVNLYNQSLMVLLNRHTPAFRSTCGSHIASKNVHERSPVLNRTLFVPILVVSAFSFYLVRITNYMQRDNKSINAILRYMSIALAQKLPSYLLKCRVLSSQVRKLRFLRVDELNKTTI